MTKQMLEQWIASAQKSSLMEGHSYSCLMAPAPPDISDAVLSWGQMFITDDELYEDPEDPGGFGRESDVHVTVKFGLHEAEPSEELLRIIEETQPFEIEIGPCTLFDTSKDFDVVKFDVDGEALRELNERVSQLENSDSHPEYKPHMTVAYVTKGTCNELIGKPLLDPESTEARFLVKAVTFSGKNKTKTTLFLGKPNMEPVSDAVDESVGYDDEMDIEDARAVYGDTFKRFTSADLEAAYSDFPVIRAEAGDLIDMPARKHQQQHPSGFGPKVGAGQKICFNGRLYRLQVWDHGDHSSVWFKANGRRIFVW